MSKMVTLRYFGAVAELTGKECETLSLQEAGATVEAISAYCHTRYPGLDALSYKVAVNKRLVTNAEVKAADELAFLPPFSGG